MASLPRLLTAVATAAITGGFVAFVPFLGAQSAAASSPPPGPGVTIVHEHHHDQSAPLRTMTAVPVSTTRHEDEPIRTMPQHPSSSQPDRVIQATISPTAPAISTSFDGLGQGFSGPQGNFSVTGVPPDPNASVGTTQIVEVVNTGFAVFSKSGSVLYGPAATNTLFSGFGGDCASTDDGDATVRFDDMANRWVITQFAFASSTSGPYYECVAVSQTADATGAYNRYSYQFSNFPDYP